MQTNTKLLVSVTNVEEALIALQANVDIVDLKDPSIGALGALPANTIKEIVAAINKRAVVSATVGEHHQSITDLTYAIEQTSLLGVDIIKIALDQALAYDLQDDKEFLYQIQLLAKNNIRLIAVLFADQDLTLNILPILKKLDFYGAMLDTIHKNRGDLLYHQPVEVIKNFIEGCARYQLVAGLAGSLNVSAVSSLAHLKPQYLGFRGGVCRNLDRKSQLDNIKIIEIKDMLQKSNKTYGLPH